MAENTNENQKDKFSIEKTKLTPIDEVESAKILFQEGLIEEAKKILNHLRMTKPGFAPALELLQKIQKDEERLLFQKNSRASPSVETQSLETQDELISKLSNDLGLNFESKQGTEESFVASVSLSAREHYDLGVAYFQMQCYADALRELKKAERRIRLEESFLGSLGVSVVALSAECLLLLGRAFEAKVYLDPILSEPEINLEEKLVFFYLHGLIDLELGKNEEAKSWLRKVIEIEPQFRDAAHRLKLIK